MTGVLTIWGFTLAVLSGIVAAEVSVDRRRSWIWALWGFFFPVAGALLVFLLPVREPKVPRQQ